VGVGCLLVDAMMPLGGVAAAINRLPVDLGSAFTKTYRWQPGAEIQVSMGSVTANGRIPTRESTRGCAGYAQGKADIASCTGQLAAIVHCCQLRPRYASRLHIACWQVVI